MAPTYSGITAVASAGTAVQLGTAQITGSLALKAPIGNSGIVYVGNVSGDVAVTNGFPLSPGEVIIFENVGNLSTIWVDAAENGDEVAWLKLEV